ncbi:hypothetical protein HMSSN036_66180 [Paenibacillus macerans]|nr:hypothetical protein HMSSN036_66180 [Paenibacillus macerans]
MEMTKKRNILIDDTKFSTTKGPWFGELPVPEGGDYDFAFISDRTGGAVHEMFEKGLEAAKRLNPDFIVSIGDLVEGYWTDEAEAHGEWDRIDPLLAGLGVPVFQTVGNHDYGTEAMIRVWRERKGIDYYAFRYDRTLFLVANTETAPLSLPEAMLELMQQANRELIRNPQALFMDLMRDLAGDNVPAEAWKMTEDTLIDPHLSEEQIDFSSGCWRTTPMSTGRSSACISRPGRSRTRSSNGWSGCSRSVLTPSYPVTCTIWK